MATKLIDECDRSYTDNAVCPYCGHVEVDSWEYHLSDGGETEEVCRDCDRSFIVSCDVTVSYSTWPVDG